MSTPVDINAIVRAYVDSPIPIKTPFDWNTPMFPSTPTPPTTAGAKAPPPPPPPPPPNPFAANSNRFAALSVSDDSDGDPDDPDDISDDYEEKVEPQLIAEFEELVRYNDAIQGFASTHFATHPDPSFKHPLQWGLHLMKLGLATLNAPPSEAIPASLPPRPIHAERGVQATPKPALPVPPARITDHTPPPTARKPKPASPAPRSPSPSTPATFDKVLAHLSALRKEVSPPPSPPLTPRPASPASRAEDCTITVVVPYGTTSLTVDRFDQAWSLKLAAQPPPAPVHRGRSPSGRPLAAFGTSVSAPHESGHQGPLRRSRFSFGSVS